jgi:hypothetical protein
LPARSSRRVETSSILVRYSSETWWLICGHYALLRVLDPEQGIADFDFLKD